jgi:hypothetical protein
MGLLLVSRNLAFPSHFMPRDGHDALVGVPQVVGGQAGRLENYLDA